LTQWLEKEGRPLVLFLDHIDKLNRKILLSILRQIQAGYDKQADQFPQSLVLCMVQEVPGLPSGFKIVSPQLGICTMDEVKILLLQHTTETGQAFDEQAIDAIWEFTGGRLWLINKIAYEACFKMEDGKGRTLSITGEIIERASQNLNRLFHQTAPAETNKGEGQALASQPGTSPDRSVKRQRQLERLEARFSRRGIVLLRVRKLISVLMWFFLVQPVSVFKRFFDFFLALAITVAVSPLLLLVFFSLLPRHKILERNMRVGRWAEPFYCFSFAMGEGFLGRFFRKLGITKLPVLFNIIRGDMSFVGPRATGPAEMSQREEAVRRRQNIRPGLVSLWWIRKRGNIDYESEIELDIEYVESRSFIGDFGIMLRMIPAVLYGSGVSTGSDSVTIQGISIDNLTMRETVESIVRALDGSHPHQIIFVNVDCINISYRNPKYKEVLSRAWLVLPDGIGLKIAGKLLRQDIKQNVNGTDLFPRLMNALEGTEHGVFLFGARPGVAEDVRAWVEQHCPGTLVSGVQHGYFLEREAAEVIQRIKDSGSKLLLVALGAPQQDLWIAEHLKETGARVAIGVGGLFDFYSGRIPRAPMWMREIGLEWLYRFTQEPGRMWKRYFVGNLVFLWRTISEKVKGSNGF